MKYMDAFFWVLFAMVLFLVVQDMRLTQAITVVLLCFAAYTGGLNDQPKIQDETGGEEDENDK